ncbi:Wadjet anti-phage system protein JetD domain-containing protein [Clostridium sp. DL1XJH146]
MNKLKKIEKRIITLEELEKIIGAKEYIELYNLINDMVENKQLIPVKNSGGNGKTPVLYKKYRVLKEKKEQSDLLEELNYKIHPKLDITYYKNHLEKYKEYRKYILLLNEFIMNRKELLKVSISMNERAFQIWGREKFIQKEEGKVIIKNLGLDQEYLNYYDTTEPLAYFSKGKETPQNILILENKDTYYTMRRHLINGGDEILGQNITTLIYGGGKSINKAFSDFEISVEEYVSNKDNKLYYFGDLDYEGIIIYERFYKLFIEDYNVQPFIKGYEMMINKYEEIKMKLPKTKDGQNRNIKDIFLDNFSNEYRAKIIEILENDLYIPQEIINITDL